MRHHPTSYDWESLIRQSILPNYIVQVKVCTGKGRAVTQARILVNIGRSLIVTLQACRILKVPNQISPNTIRVSYNLQVLMLAARQ